VLRASTSRSLIGLAWLNVFVHVTALVLAAIGMRPGTPLVPLSERLSYLAGRPAGWTLGWVIWMGCAMALVAFLAALTHRLGEDARLAQLGLMIAVAGAAFDLMCDSVYIVVLPMLASRWPESEVVFLTVERVTGIGSLVIANGAYSISVFLFARALHDRPGLTRFTTGVGYAVAGFGLLLATAGFTGIAWHAEWATPPVIGLFCLWVVFVAHSIEPARNAS